MNKLNFLKLNQLIFIALLMGMLVFGAIAFFLNKDQAQLSINTQDPFTFIAPVLLVAGIFAGNFIYKKLLSQIRNAKNLQQKVGVYTSSSIIRYALIEGPVLFSIVAFLISANSFFLIFTVVGILYFLTLKPNPDKIAREADLTYDERSELGMK